jgi:phosphohistidine phosphatase
MILYVMRHGPAEDQALSGRDADRKLTQDGRELVGLAARELSRQASASTSVSVARIVASPFARARETAEIVRTHVSSVSPEVDLELREELVPDDVPPLRLVRELVGLEGGSLIVGHQPGLEQLVRSLLDSKERVALPFGFRTAMIAGLELDTASELSSAGADPVGLGRWRLRMMLDPRAK